MVNKLEEYKKARHELEVLKADLKATISDIEYMIELIEQAVNKHDA